MTHEELAGKRRLIIVRAVDVRWKRLDRAFTTIVRKQGSRIGEKQIDTIDHVTVTSIVD